MPKPIQPAVDSKSEEEKAFLHVRCTESEKNEWRKAARIESLTLAAWVKRTNNREALLVSRRTQTARAPRIDK